MTVVTSHATTHSNTVVRAASPTYYSDNRPAVRVARVVLEISTCQSMELVDLTGDVAAVIAEIGLWEGWVDLFCRHTSCGLLINENESGLRADLCTLSRELVEGHPHRLWTHDDLSVRTENLVDGERANAHSHMLTAMFTSPSLKVPIENGSLDLGSWQRLLLWEFDGPRPDLDLPEGAEPVHPVRQVVLDGYSSKTSTTHRNNSHIIRNGNRP